MSELSQVRGALTNRAGREGDPGAGAAAPNGVPAASNGNGAVVVLTDARDAVEQAAVDAAAIERPDAPIAVSTLATVALTLVFWTAFVLVGVTGAALAAAIAPAALAAACCRTAQRVANPAGDSSLARLRRSALIASLGLAVLVVSAALAGVQLTALAAALTWAGAAWVAASADRARRVELRYRSRMKRAFVIGSEREVAAFSHEAARHGAVSLVGAEKCLPEGYLERSAGEVSEHVARVRPSVVVVADRCLDRDDLSALAWQISVGGVRVRRLSDFYETEFHKVALGSVAGSWFLFDVAEIHRRRLYGAAKRLAESLIALTVLLAALVLIVPLAIGIKLSSPGPVFFRQWRVGRAGRRFPLLKFRTMHPDATAEEGHWVRSNDPRIFPFGRFMRQFRLDELPQLWNVLRGDLSLVGPRPEQPALVAELARTVPYYTTRECVRPGLTGWAQVNYGYGGSELGTRAKLEYDLYYIKHQSLALDLKVVLATVTTMVSGGGS